MESTEALRPNDWKARTMVIGGVLGALAGVLAAMMFIRSTDAAGKARPHVAPKAALTVGMNVLDVLRQFAGLAEK